MMSDIGNATPETGVNHIELRDVSIERSLGKYLINAANK